MIRELLQPLYEQMMGEPVEVIELYEYIVPKERPRHTAKGSHTYTPKRTQDCEKYIRGVAEEIIGKPFTCPVKVTIMFREPVPESYNEAKRYLADADYIVPSKGDLDNKVKTITDALNGVAYLDDNLICELEVDRRYSDNHCTTVEIKQAGFNPRQVAEALKLLKRK